MNYKKIEIKPLEVIGADLLRTTAKLREMNIEFDVVPDYSKYSEKHHNALIELRDSFLVKSYVRDWRTISVVSLTESNSFCIDSNDLFEITDKFIDQIKSDLIADAEKNLKQDFLKKLEMINDSIGTCSNALLSNLVCGVYQRIFKTIKDD